MKKPARWIILAGLIILGLTGTFIACTESGSGPGPAPTHQAKEIVPEHLDKPPMPHQPDLAQEPLQPPADEAMFEFLEKTDPERLQRLTHLEATDPDAFHRMLQEARRDFARVQELKQRDPERFEQLMQERQMEQAIGKLAQHYRKTTNAEEKEKIKKELRTHLEKLFDLREAQRATEIKRLEEELTRLKDRAKNRQDNRVKIIERREKDLLGEEDDMKW